MKQLIEHATRMLFFTGKGGVGKTSLACAVAVGLADRGKRVLLVSTDPASNLGQVFGVEVGEHEATAIRDVPGLFVLNINPEAAAQAYRDRIIGPMRDTLPHESVKGMEEQLSGACTTEIAAFDEFTELLTGGEFDDRFRPRDLRHGTDGTHAAASPVTVGVDEFPREQSSRRIMPGSAGWPGEATAALCPGCERVGKRRANHLRAGHPSAAERPRGGGANQW